MAVEKDISARPVLLVGIVSVILLVVVGVGLSALFLGMQETEAERKAGEQGPRQLRRIREEQRRSLEEYRYVDKEKGIVSIPIERAMEEVVREAAGGGR
jgi:hypothetical protein